MNKTLWTDPQGQGIFEQIKPHGHGQSYFTPSLSRIASVCGRGREQKYIYITTTTPPSGRPHIHGMILYFFNTIALVAPVDND